MSRVVRRSSLSSLTSLLVVLLFVSSLVVYAPLSSSHERTTEGREVKWDERRGEGEHRETDTRRTEPRREIDGRSLTRHLTVGSVPPSLTSRLSLSSLISLTPLVSLGSFFVPSSLRSCAPPSLTHSVHRDRREPRRVEHSETRRDVTGGHGERK